MSEWALSINSDGITEAGCTLAKPGVNEVVGGGSAQSRSILNLEPPQQCMQDPPQPLI